MHPDWDQRYRDGLYDHAPDPHFLLRRFIPLIPRHRPVIEIAMGPGKDALYLARSGFRVYGIERSPEAIHLARREQKSLSGELQPILCDAAFLPLKPSIAGAVVVFNFLERNILSELTHLLLPGGILIYETFLKHQASVDACGPRSKAYLLDDGELFERFQRLELLFYEEGYYNEGGKRKALARFVGRKR